MPDDELEELEDDEEIDECDDDEPNDDDDSKAQPDTVHDGRRTQPRPHHARQRP